MVNAIPIGYYEKETEGEGYEEFKTLGAKKICCP